MLCNRDMHRILTKVSGKGMNSSLRLTEGVRAGFLEGGRMILRIPEGWSLKSNPKGWSAAKQLKKLLWWKDTQTTFLAEKNSPDGGWKTRDGIRVYMDL